MIEEKKCSAVRKNLDYKKPYQVYGGGVGMWIRELC